MEFGSFWWWRGGKGRRDGKPRYCHVVVGCCCLATTRELGHLPHIPHVTEVGPPPIPCHYERLAPSLLDHPLPLPHNIASALPKMTHSNICTTGRRGHFFPLGIKPARRLPSPLLSSPCVAPFPLPPLAPPCPRELDRAELRKCLELLFRLLGLEEREASCPGAATAHKGRGWDGMSQGGKECTYWMEV